MSKHIEKDIRIIIPPDIIFLKKNIEEQKNNLNDREEVLEKWESILKKKEIELEEREGRLDILEDNLDKREHILNERESTYHGEKNIEKLRNIEDIYSEWENMTDDEKSKWKNIRSPETGNIMDPYTAFKIINSHLRL